jgi:hypothetical protein
MCMSMLLYEWATDSAITWKVSIMGSGHSALEKRVTTKQPVHMDTRK